MQARINIKAKVLILKKCQMCQLMDLKFLRCLKQLNRQQQHCGTQQLFTRKHLDSFLIRVFLLVKYQPYQSLSGQFFKYLSESLQNFEKKQHILQVFLIERNICLDSKSIVFIKSILFKSKLNKYQLFSKKKENHHSNLFIITKLQVIKILPTINLRFSLIQQLKLGKLIILIKVITNFGTSLFVSRNYFFLSTLTSKIQILYNSMQNIKIILLEHLLTQISLKITKFNKQS
ncbi:hypothetical protein ABPG72_022626 [Tetrahymena utriculariae]